jgi:hypothetical protein
VDAAAVAVLKDELRQRLSGKVDVFAGAESPAIRVPS